jgi:DHA1 family multidrug resistance protein-like MFS transporter
VLSLKTLRSSRSVGFSQAYLRHRLLVLQQLPSQTSLSHLRGLYHCLLTLLYHSLGLHLGTRQNAQSPAPYTVMLTSSRPLIGGFATEGKGWRWTQWTILFFAAVFHPPVLFMRESYKATLLQRRAKQAGTDGPQTPSTQKKFRETVKYFLRTTIIRPLHMLFTETTVGFVCMYTGFQFALLYTFVVASPYVFASVYDFNLSQQGLSFLGLITGCIIAPYAILLIDWKMYQPKLARLRASQQNTTSATTSTNDLMLTLPPEDRLYGAMIGSFILPTGLFIFAWTARPDIHWIVPIIAQGISILGSILVYVSSNFFMVDTYGAKYGASASGASSLTRYTLSAAFPLFTLQFYRAVGVGWATSILGFCTILMAPIPWVFFRWGPVLRSRSAYEHGT